ncbi:MAG: pyridoxal phosphate-dependent aminotransferase [Rhodobacteraceae bacterium]|jgi:cystathionine beta-lyase|uniref:MalY/PatB family protein n=1 Tax=Albidovulum sp. TaxID=1872424 RepID=UPI001DCDEDD9|nr:MalY/PatB family protein [uncultured Defluviimonas sp.]MCB2126929.1 pyridoxal phosphate-dependent aminotransferase [Paracoccaceae bacterium]MCC0069528.1 pyridoxal phosphate-dependent aminotransferase [Paracoccaceae bacterium]
MNFDEIIDRTGTHSSKWDMMEPLYGVSPKDGLSMWVADMDFRPPGCVQQAVEAMAAHGIYGYFGDDRAYLGAICWWMRERHGWQVEPKWVFTVHGLVNGTGLCVDAFTAPGDGVVLMTPVYHAFARVIKAAGRRVVECPLANEDGRYSLDIAAWDAMMTGAERMLILCSPHNPGGRVWRADELRAIADFAKRHDLVLVSDEIHHDLVFPGAQHRVMATAAPDIADRLVTMTATTKTFNIAGAHIGNVIIADDALRARFGAKVNAFGISPNSFGMHMATAAYSPEGAAWVDALVAYLDGNRQVFDAGIAAVPGLASMALEATYLAWVDFAGTGMAPAEFTARVEKDAGIAANHGATFGKGGESFLRFNLATPRARVAEAVERLQSAFADLQ